jgi:hypothetical protein
MDAIFASPMIIKYAGRLAMMWRRGIAAESWCLINTAQNKSLKMKRLFVRYGKKRRAAGLAEATPAPSEPPNCGEKSARFRGPPESAASHFPHLARCGVPRRAISVMVRRKTKEIRRTPA